MAERELIPQNFPETEQKCLVQGVVTEITENVAWYVITHVLDGQEDILDDDFYPTYRTASRFSRWYDEVPNFFRPLWEESRRQHNGNLPTETDFFDLPTSLELTPGDTIHLHETVFWEPMHPGSENKQGHIRIDVCKLPVPNIGIQATLATLAEERSKKVKEAMNKLTQLEVDEMCELERVKSGTFIRPFKEPGSHDPAGKYYQHLGTRFVYGEGPISDHFVEITARTAYEGDLELGGTRRFGVDGTQYIALAIMPFGSGSIEDPLYKLRIGINSDTKLNPAVSEVRLVILIDGVKYQALLNPEESSHYFENPGHHMVFDGFRQEGVQFDMAQLTQEQIEALDARFKRERDISLRKVYQRVEKGEDLVTNLETIEDEATAEVQRQNEIYQSEQAIIDSIANNEPSYTISSGTSILVPRSMLDSIELGIESMGE